MSDRDSEIIEGLERLFDEYDGALRRLAEQEAKEGDILVANNRAIKVGFKRLRDEATIPTKAHATDSGFDLYALEDTIIEPGETAIVPTGIAVKLPPGYEAQIRPRSGVTMRSKLRVQLGTIDNDYRGELGIIVDNINPDNGRKYRELKTIDGLGERVSEYYAAGSYRVRKGDRVAQLVIQPLPSFETYEIEGELDETERGEGGFGSTGARD